MKNDSRLVKQFLSEFPAFSLGQLCIIRWVFQSDVFIIMFIMVYFSSLLMSLVKLNLCELTDDERDADLGMVRLRDNDE